MSWNAETIAATGSASLPEPPQRPSRAAKLSTKVRETLISFESNAEPSRKTPNTTARLTGAAAIDGRTNTAQRLLVVAGETRQDIEDVKAVIRGQNDLLVKLISELTTVKTELATVKAELSEVKKQIVDEL